MREETGGETELPGIRKAFVKRLLLANVCLSVIMKLWRLLPERQNRWNMVQRGAASLFRLSFCLCGNYQKRSHRREGGSAIMIGQEVARMQRETENRDTQELRQGEKLGEVKIADEVVAMIAGLAATEVEGVDSMAGNITNELVGKLGMKNLNKGVKVNVDAGHVSVELSLNMKYGCSIPAVSEEVQERVRTAVETMTGLTVLEVNIKIAGVNMSGLK